MSALIRRIINTAKAPAPIGPYRWESCPTLQTSRHGVAVAHSWGVSLCSLKTFPRNSPLFGKSSMIFVKQRLRFYIYRTCVFVYYILSSWGSCMNGSWASFCTLNFVQWRNKPHLLHESFLCDSDMQLCLHFGKKTTSEQIFRLMFFGFFAWTVNHYWHW